jgi:pentalenene oxygenase
MNRFIDEVHRLYPAEWLLWRVASGPDKLPGGLDVRRGDQMLINLYSMLHNPQVFANPDRCEPNRFVNNLSKTNSSYMPFGAGPRSCMGQMLSRMMIGLTLTSILSRWQLSSIDEDIRIESPNCFSMQVAGPVMIRFVERDRKQR